MSPNADPSGSTPDPGAAPGFNYVTLAVIAVAIVAAILIGLLMT